jgi:ubiquinone/menaquinone biosynthesis C-methylase UbiE
LELSEQTDRLGDVIVTGELKSSTNSYPIIRGIPRFVAHHNNSYADSFGTQWSRWPRVQFEDANIGGPMEGHTTKMFEKIIGSENCASLKDKIVADIGVGAGRFADVVVKAGGRVIGIDLSSAVEVARKNHSDHSSVLIIQGDALCLPIANNALDGIYSIGVLHHTPDPKKGLNEMYSTVRPDGWIALAVYTKGGYYDSIRVSIWRKILKLAGKLFKNDRAVVFYSKLCSDCLYKPSFIPILGHAIRLCFPMVRLADPRWRLLDTYDSVTPSYQSAHTSEEVSSWFTQLGCKDIQQSPWAPSAYRGIK